MTDRWTRDNWPAEVLRRAIGKIREAPEGSRHDELIGAAARVADYVAAGALSRGVVEAELLAAAIAAGIDGKREKEARRCIAFGLDKGQADGAWYPDSGGAEPVVRRYRWLGGQILALQSVPRRRVEQAPIPVLDMDAGAVRVTWYPDLRATQGAAESWTWADLAEAASSPMDWPANGKAGVPMWGFSEVEGDSRAQRPDGVDDTGRERVRAPIVHRVHAIVLDYDDEDAWSCELMARWWAGVRHIAHTTAHHLLEKPLSTGSRPSRPRGRVIMDISRPLSEAEYVVVARWLLACGRGAIGEVELRNPRRAYFVPARAPGGYEWAYHEGGALDVDRILGAQADADEEATTASEATAPEEGVIALLDATPKGLRDSLRNVVTVLDSDSRQVGRWTRCTFSARDLLDGAVVTDAAEVETACWLDEVYQLHVGVDRVHQAIVAVAARHRVHPVREYLDGLTWDHEERLPHWLVSWAGVDEVPLAETYGVAWMISAVARVYSDDPRGVQADSALVLAGPKGLGKTSVLRVMGCGWHSESTIAIGERDGYQQLQGVWIYELGEMSALRKSEVEAVKLFLTARVDRYRPPYGRNVVEVPRQCVFAGTTNDIDGFLVEGDRRWWVLRVVRKADLAGLGEVRDQIWAEAVYRYRRGERWHLTGAEEEAQRVDVERYRHVDPWEELIARRYPSGRVQVSDVLVDLLRRDRQEDPDTVLARATRADQMRVARILRELGWVKVEVAGRNAWRKT